MDHAGDVAHGGRRIRAVHLEALPEQIERLVVLPSVVVRGREVVEGGGQLRAVGREQRAVGGEGLGVQGQRTVVLGLDRVQAGEAGERVGDVDVSLGQGLALDCERLFEGGERAVVLSAPAEDESHVVQR
eukprot:8990-Eustigmatos_ZCMA.PRE.1